MNIDELASRDPKELRILAAKYGIKTHHRAKAETIAKLIVEHVTTKPHGQDALKHAAEKPAKKEAVLNTEEEIRAVIAPFAAKDGYEVRFLDNNTTWLFRYNGSEESGHCSVPLRLIRIKAEGVSRGARRPRAISDVMHGGTSDLVLMI